MYLASLQLDDEESQIEYLQKSIDLNTNDPMIYYYIFSVYSKKNYKNHLTIFNKV